jgi:UDP-glucose 4-epimerase/GDP-4-dehydro-6-deoxy-D-mannose reductase
MLKIGITGSTGVLGRNILKKINLKKKIKIIPFKFDIKNSSQVKIWIKKNNFDVIFHLAAIVPVKICEENPLKACSVNIGGTINILNAIKNIKKKPWFFYASTSHVYKPQKKTLLESDEISPKSFYGHTKWISEKILVEFSKAHNLKYCCGRIFSFYDNKQPEFFLYQSIKKKLKKNKNKNIIKIINAESVIDIQKSENVAKTIIKLFEKRAEGIVNIGTGKGITIKNFAKKITKKKIKIETIKQKRTYSVANIKKLNSIIKNDAIKKNINRNTNF